VQYQGVVLLMIVMVAWCALRFWRARTNAHEWLYLALGALCWAFAMLTHWDGALAGAMLAYVVVCKWGWRVSRTRLVSLVLIGIAALLVPALFYAQLLLNPQVSNLKTYAGERIGFGVFNGLPAFMLHATFYDASLFSVVLLLLAGVFLWQHLRGWPRVLLALMLVPFVVPDFLQLGAWNFSLVVFVATLLLLLRASTLTVERKMLVVWLFAYFVVYAFVVKSAGLHFYTLMPALALLAAQVAIPASTRDAQYASRTLDTVRVVGCVLLLMVAVAFDVVAYLNALPEYALNFPQSALPVFPTLYRERPRDFFFGFPYRYGWSVIGELYRRGTLRGKFESNETYLVTDWYARDLEVARGDEPRYYLRVNDSPRAGEVIPDLDERFHAWGEVRVNGAAKIFIYERNGATSPPLRTYDAETFPTSDPLLLMRSLTYRQARGDDRAFRELGRFLDRSTSARDVLVLDTPLQDAIVPYYYRGEASIVSAPAVLDGELSDGSTVYASLWSAGATERWLAQHLFPLDSRWFGSVRLATYAPPSSASALHVPATYFGYDVQLLDAQIVPTTPRAG
ncbi:MAG: hypothetical protein LC737_07870, partial [Chloroflexi bacterium]|nr:hypothetical protein [Chloroflexota bacterium]